MNVRADLSVHSNGVSHRYANSEARVIADCDAHFESGAVTAITGPSGSGKSTLLYILALLLTPSNGSVEWGAETVSSLPDGQRSALRARRAGFVFQDAMLDPAKTVLGNITEQAVFAGVDRRTAGHRAHDLAERFGIEHRLTGRPGEISGGQAQRVALCRALLTSPQVVFADEPTGNLDHEAATLVIEALEERAREGACVIIATHDNGIVRRADRRVRL